jgi:hypothetical protein
VSAPYVTDDGRPYTLPAGASDPCEYCGEHGHDYRRHPAAVREVRHELTRARSDEDTWNPDGA